LILKSGVQLNRFLLEAGGAFEFSQTVSDIDNISNIAFAGELGFTWLLPTNINRNLSFTCIIAGGEVNNTVGAFVPITTKYFGNLLAKNISGTSVLNLTYSARFNQKTAMSLTALYFVRNDLKTYIDYPVTRNNAGLTSDNYFLGAEIFGRFFWRLYSDIQFTFSGGIFLPSLGDVGPNEKPLWRLEAAAVISIL